MGRPSNRLATAAAVMAGIGVLALAGRLLPLAPGAAPPAATTTTSSLSPARTDVWPNATPRRLRLGQGATTATYRVVAADPVHDALEVVLTTPRGVDVQLWLRTPIGRRVMISSTKRGCRPASGQVRCLVTWAAQEAEAPGIWTIGVAKRSAGAAAVRVKVSFLPPS
jgi:hypothetical protein